MSRGEPAPPLAMHFRPAAPQDLVSAARLHAAGDVDMARRLHPATGLTGLDKAARARSVLTTLQELHDADPRQIWVAMAGDRVAGVASATFRGRHAHIQSYFVAPAIQQRGVGKTLLHYLTTSAREAGCDLFTLQASDDPRGLTRYVQIGLQPQPPNIVWSTAKPDFPTPALDDPFEPIALSTSDAATLNTVSDIDKAVRGVKRPSDIQRWLNEGASGALLADRQSSVPAGYYLVSNHGGAGRIGPVAAIDEARFGEVLRIALIAAGAIHRPGTIWRVATPGENHAAVAPLLAARFRPTRAITFFTSGPIGQFDRYLFHDLALL